MAQVARYAALPVVAVGAAALALAVVPVGAAVFGVYKLRENRRRSQWRRRARRRRVQGVGHTDLEYKILLSGDGGVGKSTTATQFIYGRFIEEYDPFDDSWHRQVSIDEDAVLLHLQECDFNMQFTALRDHHIRDYPYHVVIYDITSRSSFESVPAILDHIRRVKDVDDLPPTVIVGNKSDLEEKREVTTEEGRALATAQKALFFESSAKDRALTETIFFNLVRAAKRNASKLVL